MLSPRTPACLLLTALLLAAPLVSHADDVWPRWRGPRQDGHYGAALPQKWSAENIVWKTALPGIGQSSPVTWGDRIFLTAYLDRSPQVAEELLAELDRARIVDDGRIAADVVRMGSTLRFTSDLGEDRRVTLVFPGEAEIAEGKVSVLTPI